MLKRDFLKKIGQLFLLTSFIPSNAFAAIAKIIKTNGNRGSFEAELADGGVEVTKSIPNEKDLWLEFQWRWISGRLIQKSMEPSPDLLFSIKIPSKYKNIYVLPSEMGLLGVCLHTAKHTFIRSPGLRLHTDVDRIVSQNKINWSKFLELVSIYEVKTISYLSLYLSRFLLKTEIPEFVFVQLANGKKFKLKFLLSWIQKKEFFDNNRKHFNNLEYIIFNILLFDSFKQIIKGLVEVSCDNQGNRVTGEKKVVTFFYKIRDLVFNRTGI